MPEKKLSIIIVNHNSKQYLRGCLKSVCEKIIRYVPAEIIVVCNDGEKIEEEDFSCFPETRFIYAENNKGFGAANNLGANVARGEWLFFLNPDTEIISDNISKALEEFSNKNVGIIGLRLVTPQKDVQEWSAGYEIKLKNILMNNFKRIRDKELWNSERIAEAGWVSGAALIIRKELFESLQGFDEKYFMYFEDADLCQRARKSGKKIIYYPFVQVMHYGGGSADTKAAQKKSYYISQDYYFKKHRGLFEAILLRFFRMFHS